MTQLSCLVSGGMAYFRQLPNFFEQIFWLGGELGTISTEMDPELTLLLGHSRETLHACY